MSLVQDSGYYMRLNESFDSGCLIFLVGRLFFYGKLPKRLLKLLADQI